jgi:hypothetical protein
VGRAPFYALYGGGKVLAPPAITSIDPAAIYVDTAGELAVIGGANLSQVSVVIIGATPCPAWGIMGASTLWCEIPASSTPGVVDVICGHPDGPLRLVGGFEYLAGEAPPIPPLEIVDWAACWAAIGPRWQGAYGNVAGNMATWPDEGANRNDLAAIGAPFGVPSVASESIIPTGGSRHMPNAGAPQALGIAAAAAPVPRPWGFAVVLGVGSAWGYDVLGGDTAAHPGAAQLRVTGGGAVTLFLTRTNSNTLTISAPALMTPGWHLAMCDIDAAGLARVWFDGTEGLEAITTPGNLDTTLNAFTLGASRARLNNGFSGYIPFAGVIARTFTLDERAGLAAWALDTYGDLAPPMMAEQHPEVPPLGLEDLGDAQSAP